MYFSGHKMEEFCINIAVPNSMYCNKVEGQWLEPWWLIYHSCFELVLESLGKIP